MNETAPAHDQHDHATPDYNAADQTAASSHEHIENTLDVILTSQEAPADSHAGPASPLPQPPALAQPGPLGADMAPADYLPVIGQDAPAEGQVVPDLPQPLSPTFGQTGAETTPTDHNVIELPDNLLEEMIAESTTPQPQQTSSPDLQADQTAKEKKTYPVWIHKADFSPISQQECDALKTDLMKNFLTLAREGELKIDFRFTSKWSDIKSGKIKLTSECPESADAIRMVLANIPYWRVLSADDLDSQEGKTFWVFCPSVCFDFVRDNSLNELIRAHTGWFLEVNDVKTSLPPKRIKETNNHLCYIFLSYKAQVYFKYFNWRISLLGCTLKLQQYGDKRDTTPTLTKDDSPTDLVTSMSSSTLEKR